MSQKILQINFKFTQSANDYIELCAPFADPIAAVPGLIWKVWLLNEQGPPEISLDHLPRRGGSLPPEL